jgi:hypothetical protein
MSDAAIAIGLLLSQLRRIFGERSNYNALDHSLSVDHVDCVSLDKAQERGCS